MSYAPSEPSASWHRDNLISQVKNIRIVNKNKFECPLDDTLLQITLLDSFPISAPIIQVLPNINHPMVIDGRITLTSSKNPRLRVPWNPKYHCLGLFINDIIMELQSKWELPDSELELQNMLKSNDLLLESYAKQPRVVLLLQQREQLLEKNKNLAFEIINKKKQLKDCDLTNLEQQVSKKFRELDDLKQQLLFTLDASSLKEAFKNYADAALIYEPELESFVADYKNARFNYYLRNLKLNTLY